MRFCLFVPKFTYTLRCTKLWKFQDLLVVLDDTIKRTLCAILNIALDDTAWIQASLPIRFGGLGIRKATSVSLPAFLSSAHSANPLCGKVLNSSLGSVGISGLAEAVEVWRGRCPVDMPDAPHVQRQWDEPLCKQVLQNLISGCLSSVDRARILAVSERESGFWLQAFPSANLGTLLDNCTLSIIVGLRLGVKIVEPHQCVCGELVNELGHHGLACQRSAGRMSRHASLNDIIRRALSSTSVPSVLEPVGLLRTDGKRPDGLSLIPWKLGKCLIWDATCVDTLAPTHLPSTCRSAGAAAATAEGLKRRK
ncbi:hypothetical protein NE865_00656 [Phthorimaea operculella]|nr:hypothetical protein NE865_00656 [Phthorimaea operculella]